MTQIDRTPTYNLKAVVRETGLKADTLRAWERRYGVPTPQRTDSGHRLYSQYDIEIVKWLIERQDEGLSISRAIDLLHRFEEDGQDPLDSIVSPGIHRSAEPRTPLHGIESSALGESGTIQVMRSAWVDACLSFDEFRAEQLLSQAFALFPAEIVCIDLIQSGLHDIGEGWYTGRVTVQQEHFASALAIRRMEALLASTPVPTRPGRILVGCPPEEEHTFVPLLLSLLLRRRGWDVVYLGANVPLRSLEATLTSIRPNLVVLTAQQLHTAASLMEMAELLLRERVPVAFGGLIFTEVADLHLSLPGYYLGDKLEGAIAEIEQVMVSLKPQPAQHQVTYDYREALEHFRLRQVLIDAEIWQQMSAKLPNRMLATANLSFGRSILAALTLGNMNFLDADIEWVEGLLVNHHEMPADALDEYLNAYYDACVGHLDRRGLVVIEWLSRLLGRQISTSVQEVSGEAKRAR